MKEKPDRRRRRRRKRRPTCKLTTNKEDLQQRSATQHIPSIQLITIVVPIPLCSPHQTHARTRPAQVRQTNGDRVSVSRLAPPNSAEWLLFGLHRFLRSQIFFLPHASIRVGPPIRMRTEQRRRRESRASCIPSRPATFPRAS